jgi:hypothetical protein
MDRLSSCYFCGDAFDASLDEYPVVPSALRPGAETQRTVVLCRGCHRKLETVLDTVVDAVEDGTGAGSDGGTQTAIDESLDGGEDVLRSVGDEPLIGAADTDDESEEDGGSERPDATSGDASGAEQSTDTDAHRETDTDAHRETDTDAHRETEADDASDERSASTAADPATTDPFLGPDDSGDTAGDRNGSTDDGGEESADSTDRTYTSSTSAGETRHRPDSGPSSDRNEPSGGSGDRSGSADRDESDDARRESAESAESGDDPSPGESLTRRDYTKVMRFLQNREFPVDKAEFVELASNTYQLSTAECEYILALGEKQGRIAERDGQIVAGEE